MLNPPFTLPTPRLTISHLDPTNTTHCAFITALIGSPDVVRLNGGVDHGIVDLAQARTFIAAGVEKLERTGYGRYLVSLRHQGRENGGDADGDVVADAGQKEAVEDIPIGVVTMQLARFPCAPTIPDLGFALLPAFYGRGYATEAAAALVAYFEQERGVAAFAGYCSAANEASRAVFRRLGWESWGTRRLEGVKGEGEAGVLWAEVWTVGVGGEEELGKLGIGGRGEEGG
ncbi:acyl-CoA N-acyltransferase [Pyrenochaeta sp. DS3sAY3a]|nr:acyl-CoA N-acyltransferase [Pyrenochaeta sp. DS3sAY3a]